MSIDAPEELVDSSHLYTPNTETLLDKIIFLSGVILALLCIILLWRRPIGQVRYTNIHIGLVFLIFLIMQIKLAGNPKHWSTRKRVELTILVAALILGIAGSLYVEIFFRELAYERFTIFTTPDMVAGTALVIGTVVATHREYGKVISSIVVFSMIFTLFGNHFPGLLQHGGAELGVYLPTITVEFSGIYHIITQIGATWIFIFLIWAGIIEELGYLDLLFDLGFLIGSYFRSGVAQTAVVASMVMGSITGSPMANIVVTGSFTIPLMKERGLRPQMAAAIESVASTGGMILPPIMGSVAFIMANFLGIAYGEIIIIAALPALLFYGAIVLSVHLIVENEDIDLTVERDIEMGSILWKSIPVSISLLVLVYLLVVPRKSAGITGVYAIFVLVVAHFALVGIVAENRINELRSVVPQVIRGLVVGSIRMVPITIVLAGMGIIITSFNFTGTGFRISLAIVTVAAGSVLVLLGLVMVSSIVLGMGMPTVAAYIVTVTLIAPAMVEFGFETITAHFFVFYFAMLASITPPIALCPAVASKIAESDFVQTALLSVKIGLPLFILPYVLAFNQSLLVFDGLNTVFTFIKALTGLVLLVIAIHSPYSFNSQFRSFATRFSLFGIGLLIIFSTQISNSVFTF